MNYLVLCQKVVELAGIPGSGPSTVIGQTGELKRVCSWVNDAWAEIQNQRDDWQWMRKDFTLATVAQQSTYTAADASLTDWGKWKDGSFTIYKTTADNESWLDQWEYEEFSDTWLFGTRKTTYARPTHIAINPARSLVLALPPDQEYTVAGEYYTSPQALTVDATIPLMPTRFHMAIVHKALMKYGYYEAGPEVVAEQTELYKAVLNKLTIDQTPKFTLGGSLI